VKTIAQVIAEHAVRQPQAAAFICGNERLSWRDYHERSDALAARLVSLGLARGERIAVWLPDGPAAHVAFVGVEKSGCVIVGIGPRAGRDELRHLLRKTRARVLLARGDAREVDLAALVAELSAEGQTLEWLRCDGHFGEGDRVYAGVTARADTGALLRDRALAADELWLLNSTSGTTGLPKCVMHDQARWIHYHDLALAAGRFTDTDVFLSALPAPFGFGIWTAHTTPTLLGVPTVLLPRFDAAELVRAIERERVSVLAAVSTQFILMLNSPELAKRDVSSLRCLFTGGEAVPYERAAEFEERTGAFVLQFYGSNETGALSCTTPDDSRDKRLRTAGRPIPSMRVRLCDEAGNDITASGRGQPACKGAVTSRGYFEDDEANRKLFTANGWMLTGDIGELDADGYLRIVGRVADFIIRGGKNISGPAVEDHVASHPAVELCAAVAMPDPVFGERVCAYVELRPGGALDLAALRAHLDARGVSKEYWPERLEVVAALPRSSGGKVAKGALREEIRAVLAAERKTP
jgi:acyl-CoA synthetase